jgi:predicted transcriptional regulator
MKKQLFELYDGGFRADPEAAKRLKVIHIFCLSDCGLLYLIPLCASRNRFYLYPLILKASIMLNENTNPVMNVELFKMKVENQQTMIKQLSGENEELYQQFNHLMIRNNKLLKRIDDQQGIIDDLHIRIEELQLINGNILKLNDGLRSRNDNSSAVDNGLLKSNDRKEETSDEITEFNKVFSEWKNYPGQDAKNEPNLRKQAQMLIHLYHHKALRAANLFSMTGVGGVTGARYVATLKKFGLITYTGARKKGQYEMTRKGADFIEASFSNSLQPESDLSFSVTSKLPRIPVIEQPGIPVREEVKEILIDHFNYTGL